MHARVRTMFPLVSAPPGAHRPQRTLYSPALVNYDACTNSEIVASVPRHDQWLTNSSKRIDAGKGTCLLVAVADNVPVELDHSDIDLVIKLNI